MQGSCSLLAVESKVWFPLRAAEGQQCCRNCHEGHARGCAVSCQGTGTLQGEGCAPQQVSAPLLQALVPSYGLITDGKRGLTDRAWDSAQGEIYARILLQCVI